MKNKKTKTMYKYVAPGVYQSGEKAYRMRKTVNGNTISLTFRNKNNAIRYYKSL